MTELPEFVRQPFSDALSTSMLLPAFVALFGVVAALFLLGAATPDPVQNVEAEEDPATEELPLDHYPDHYDDYHYDDHIDDDEADDYAEYLLAPPEADTDPLPVQAGPVPLPVRVAYEPMYHEPPERWLHSPVDQIGFAHNGSHVDREQLFREMRATRGRHAADSGPQFRWVDPDAD